MQYIDLTHAFNDHMPVFPGDIEPELTQTANVPKDGISHYRITTEMHVGTHIDAPDHMLAGGKLISDYPAQKFFGRGIIIDARGKAKVDDRDLLNIKIQSGDIVLVCFGWSTEFGKDEYYLNYPLIDETFAKAVAEIGISIVGMDTPSPDMAPYPVHKILFKSDILIIENLTSLEPLLNKKNMEIIALPPMLQTDAAPCRVVAKIL